MSLAESELPGIEICTGPECGSCGGAELIRALRELGIEAEAGHCQGLCHEAPVAQIDGRLIPEATAEKLRSS